MFHRFMGKEIIDYKLQCAWLRRRKSKAGGVGAGGKLKATQSYTPLFTRLRGGGNVMSSEGK